MQTEAFVQLMKQLTDNPSPQSIRLGWQLFSLLLQCFPPEVEVMNVVANFIRSRADYPEFYLKLAYATIRRGPRRRAPLEAELPDLLSAVEVMIKLQARQPTDAESATVPNMASRIAYGQIVSGKI